jgi:hypothetical protein
MKRIDAMISLAKTFSSSISLSKNIEGKYLVDIRMVSWKEHRRDIVQRSIFGTGLSVETACEDFMEQAKGKILFGNDKSFYGENPPEYICV